MTKHSFPVQPIARAMEIRAAAREMAQALTLGGELGEHRARQHAAAILREAVAIQRALSPEIDRAA